jgi:hypothetical protein
MLTVILTESWTWHLERHIIRTYLELNFVKDLELPAQVAELRVVLEVDGLVGNCGLDTILLCKQKET